MICDKIYKSLLFQNRGLPVSLYLYPDYKDITWTGDEMNTDYADKKKNLLKPSGYSGKAITYYINKTNVGPIEEPSAHFAYTGPCGDVQCEGDVTELGGQPILFRAL